MSQFQLLLLIPDKDIMSVDVTMVSACVGHGHTRTSSR